MSEIHRLAKRQIEGDAWLDRIPAPLAQLEQDGDRLRLINLNPAALALLTTEDQQPELSQLFCEEQLRSLEEKCVGLEPSVPDEIEFGIGISNEQRTLLLRLQLQPYSDHSSQHRRIFAALEDRTTERQAWRQIQQAQELDELTGLLNRGSFQDLLDGMVAQAAKGQIPAFGLLVVNLDGFKRINDHLGHGAGDELLISLAARLRRLVRDRDHLARLNGDEFAVVLSGIEHENDLVTIGDRLRELSEKPLSLNGHVIHPLVSVGAVSTLSGYRDGAALLHDANVALNQAKESGQRQTFLFQSAAQAQAQDRFLLQQDLRAALHNNQLELYFQPIVNSKTLTWVGAEALARWHHPTRGFISPAEFIPLAEESNQIKALGQWALETACGQIKTWLDQRLISADAPFFVSVNAAPDQLSDPHFADDVSDALAAHDVPAGRLRLELTENAVMQDPSAAKATLDRLAQRGVKTALDDFGTGHSSLAQLLEFPVQVLKIDRSFLREDRSRSASEKLIKLILNTAEMLDLDVVAEGVETVDQLDFLRSIGCLYVQGFHLGKPMPIDEFSASFGLIADTELSTI
ncbi:MAG: bifunctional diguanylate cyclase/phosphodiesterase, partial [Pseudomonadota bacterium]